MTKPSIVPTLALHMTKPAYYNEWDSGAAQWLRNLIKAGLIAPGYVDETDIQDIKPDDLREFGQWHFFAGIGVWSYALRSAGWPDGLRVLSASCPCQPFSSAGKGDGVDDERHLWPAALDIIAYLRPGFVVGEQVASKDAEPWLDTVQPDMEGLGYAFGALAFPTAGVGGPHIRDRTYWGAIDRSRRVLVPGVDFALLGDSCGARLSVRECCGLGGTGRREEGRAFEQPGGASHILAHAQGIGLGGQSGPVPCTAGRVPGTPSGQGDGHAPGAYGPVVELGHSDSLGAGRHGGAGTEAQGSPRMRAERDVAGASGAIRSVADDSRPGPTNGYWRDADWLYCRDGKWRPVEPCAPSLDDGAAGGVGLGGTGGESTSEVESQTTLTLHLYSPLAVPPGKPPRGAGWGDPAGPHGFGNRSIRLKGYGNAISAPAAIAFLECFIEIIDELVNSD